jgi:hypothetical protein
MKSTKSRRVGPFGWATAIAVILTVALMRLPETFVEQLRRNRPLTNAQAGWTYRLLAIVAFAQAAYVGFVLLRPERVRDARTSDAKLMRMSRDEVVASVARNAASISLLTLVYAFSTFALTGERGGYWLFFTLVVAQLAWYFRQVGEVAAFMEFQPEFVSGAPETTALGGDDEEDSGAHYSPPMARGVGHLEND